MLGEMSTGLRQNPSVTLRVTAPLIVGPLAGPPNLPVMPRPPLLGQRRRPPPVAETGRSCWGSGQQGASAFARSNRWEPQPVRWHRASAMMTERLYRRIAYPYERLACPLSNLSVTGFAVTAPLVGEPLAGRCVFGVWRFATVCPADATLFLPCGR